MSYKIANRNWNANPVGMERWHAMDHLEVRFAIEKHRNGERPPVAFSEELTK
jgi:hypothetical protein